jgi:putative zinc finger protein
MVESAKCAEIREVLPELAAGVADGSARVVALAHLAVCNDCRRELDDITSVMDGLVLLAPEHEPSPGFESTVLNALAPVPTRPRPLLVAALAAAAVLLVAALTGGMVWWHTGEDRQLARQYRNTLAVADGRYLSAADLSTAVEPSAGHVFAYQGTPSWVFITIDSAPSSGRFQVQLITDHRTIDVGWCQVTSGKGAWGTTIQVPIGEIRRIQLSRAGIPSMSAHFG